jgi:hypothetical protein
MDSSLNDSVGVETSIEQLFVSVDGDLFVKGWVCPSNDDFPIGKTDSHFPSEVAVMFFAFQDIAECEIVLMITASHHLWKFMNEFPFVVEDPNSVPCVVDVVSHLLLGED